MSAPKELLERREELIVLLASEGWRHLAEWCEKGMSSSLTRILQRGLDHRERDLLCEAVQSTRAVLSWPQQEIEAITKQDEKSERSTAR